MPDQPLDAATIRRYISEVADELPGAGPSRTLIVVGGALMALLGLRDATRDVDSIERIDEGLEAAVARVGRRHGLAPRWLNDSASGFRPATFDSDECEVVLDHPALRVLGAPPDQIFLMKLNAARAVDTDDLEAIWPRCSFASPEAAVEAFYAAYPNEERDEHLTDFVRSIT